MAVPLQPFRLGRDFFIPLLIHFWRAVPETVDFIDFPAISLRWTALRRLAFRREPLFQIFENLFGGPILITRLRFRRSDPQADHRLDRDRPHARAFGKRDFQQVARMDRRRRFERMPATFHFSRRAGIRRQPTGFEKAGGPQPFVGTNGFGHDLGKKLPHADLAWRVSKYLRAARSLD